jgi:HEAT repeat protein
MIRVTLVPAGLIALALAGPVAGQSLSSRIESVRDGRVGLQFPARPDVCGHGTSYIRIGNGTFVGDGVWINQNDDVVANDCEPGPARVLLTRSEGRTVNLKVGIGGGAWPEGTRDLGEVGSREAAAWFLALAREQDGRLGREALLPAVLAEGAEVWRGLLDISRNRALSRGLRESATGWLGREALTSPSAAGEIVAALRQLAEDREESAGLRTRAVRSIARLDGQATAALVSLADANDPVISRAAFQSLGRSADPRARDALRRKVREGTIPEGSRKAAIEALGGRDAVAADFALLREIWPRLTDEASREGVINALAEAGGAENLRWLLAQSGDSQMGVSGRARAIRGAVRAGAMTADLIRLYDAGQDRRVKDALIEAMGRIGDRAAVDKLIQIAQTDTDPQIRRRAVNRLSRSSDERAIAALKAMVER